MVVGLFLSFGLVGGDGVVLGGVLFEFVEGWLVLMRWMVVG